MGSPSPRRRSARLVTAMTAAIALAVGLAPPAAATPAAGPAVRAEVAPAPEDWPSFGFQGIVTNKSTMKYNPTNEYISPSVIRAGDYFENPLGEWYLYTAPHDDPGGIVLMYADSPSGPWTEYAGNPVVSREWPPDYDRVPHVSSPDTVWNAQEQKLFLYFHGGNSVTRFATSEDGITFMYGGTAVTNAMGDVAGKPKVIESSYARVFEHPDPNSPYRWAMFYMANNDVPVGGPGGVRGVRNIRLAESVDGRTWVVDPDPLFEQGAEEGVNVSGPNLWERDGQLYVLYHASSGKSYARTIDPTLREVGGTPILLHQSSGQGSDTGRVASPEIVEADGETYLFYESGDRLGGTIAWAKEGADPITTPVHGDFPGDPSNPVFTACAAAGSDEFDGGLAPVWDRVVREGTARHRVDDGALIVPTYPGGLAAAPLLQQELPEGQWQVTTRLSYPVGAPSANFQQAGLMLYAGDTQYARLTLGKATPGRGIELVAAGSPSFTDQAFTGNADRTQAWLRLTSDGNQIVAAVSYDGVAFTNFGRPFAASTLDGQPRYTHIGPYAYRGSAATEIEASFDWFRLSPSTDEYARCMTPPTRPSGVVSVALETDGAAADDPFLANVDVDLGVTCAVEEDGRRVELFAGVRSVRSGQRVAIEDDGDPVTLPAGARCWVSAVDPQGASSVTVSNDSWEYGAVVTSGSPAEPQQLELTVMNTFDAASFAVVRGDDRDDVGDLRYGVVCTYPLSGGAAGYPLASGDAAFTLAAGRTRTIPVLAGARCAVTQTGAAEGVVVIVEDSDPATDGGSSDGVLADIRGTSATVMFRTSLAVGEPAVTPTDAGGALPATGAMLQPWAIGLAVAALLAGVGLGVVRRRRDSV